MIVRNSVKAFSGVVNVPANHNAEHERFLPKQWKWLIVCDCARQDCLLRTAVKNSAGPHQLSDLER